ncbi:hypothetical protein YB2330_006019 [Saitoella coloradoensis]
MYKAKNLVVPPRPIIQEPCSCLWRLVEQQKTREHEERRQVEHAAKHTSNAVKLVKTALGFTGAFNEDDETEVEMKPHDIGASLGQRGEGDGNDEYSRATGRADTGSAKNHNEGRGPEPYGVAPGTSAGRGGRGHTYTPSTSTVPGEFPSEKVEHSAPAALRLAEPIGAPTQTALMTGPDGRPIVQTFKTAHESPVSTASTAYEEELALRAQAEQTRIATAQAEALERSKHREEQRKWRQERDERAALKSGAMNKSSGGALASRPLPDVFARNIKKRLAKSSENKIASLISYREELVNILHLLIPPRRPHDSSSTHPPIVSPVPHTSLCHTCMDQLMHHLFHSPATRSPYILDHSTSAYLSLIDDCHSSLSTHTGMESLTHYELDIILRAELSVTEWRIAVKLARYHKRTSFLDIFPVRLGEYAQLEVNRSGLGKGPGIVERLKEKAIGAVGMGSLFGARKGSSAVQGPGGREGMTNAFDQSDMY